MRENNSKKDSCFQLHSQLRRNEAAQAKFKHGYGNGSSDINIYLYGNIQNLLTQELALCRFKFLKHFSENSFSRN